VIITLASRPPRWAGNPGGSGELAGGTVKSREAEREEGRKVKVSRKKNEGRKETLMID